MTSDESRRSNNEDADQIARSTARLYDGIVDWYVDAFFEDLSDADWLDQWLSRLGPEALVADIGAGPGNFAKYIAQAGFRVVASDISPEMVKASARLTPEAMSVVADMRSLPFQEGTFDGLVCAYSLMHVPAPANREVLREFARVIDIDGYLQLMLKTGTERYSFRSTRVAGYTGVMEPWDEDDLRLQLSLLGFEIVHSERKDSTSPHEFDHPKLMVIARRTKGCVACPGQ